MAATGRIGLMSAKGRPEREYWSTKRDNHQ
jgi:hypothetical protein